MSSVARPQVDNVRTQPVPLATDAGKIERPYAEDNAPQDQAPSVLNTAKSVAKGYGDKLSKKATEAKDSLGSDPAVTERVIHERQVK